MAEQLPLYALKLVTENQVIIIGPARLVSVCISGDGAAADCDIYDGDNALMEKKLHLEAPSGESFSPDLASGVKMNFGIYVVVNAATTNVMIVYQPIEV